MAGTSEDREKGICSRDCAITFYKPYKELYDAFKANYPTKEMWSSDVMDSKNEMWWCKGFQYEKIFPCSDLFMGDNIEREYSLLNNTPEEMQ